MSLERVPVTQQVTKLISKTSQSDLEGREESKYVIVFHAEHGAIFAGY